MTLPNKLTILRIIMIPFFLIFLLCNILGTPYDRYISVIIFLLASLTDAIDGYIARKKNLITNFGKFMDPLADKLLVCSALIAMVELKNIPSWAVIIIVGREFIVTGFRLVAVDDNIVISASKWGKIKTISQMIMIIYILLDLNGNLLKFIGSILIWISIIFTIISALDYIVKNISVIKKDT